MKKSILFFSLILFFFTLFLTGCHENVDEPVNSDSMSVYEKVLKDGVLRTGVITDSKPMTYYDENGNLTGFEIDLINEIAKRLSERIKVKFIPVTNATRIEAVNSGDVDLVIATMTITDFRKISVDFSEPYFFTAQTVMIPVDSPVVTLKNLNNKRVGIVTGTTSEKSLRHFVPKAVPVRRMSFAENTEDILNGKIAAVVQDDVILKGFMSDNDGFKLFPSKLTLEPYGIAFKKSETDLKNHINAILADIKSDGTMARLKQKYGLD